jgi:hypothetical protein
MLAIAGTRLCLHCDHLVSVSGAADSRRFDWSELFDHTYFNIEVFVDFFETFQSMAYSMVLRYLV